MSAEHPFISVCVPTIGRMRYMREALESVLMQDYPEFELLVHDDSPDDAMKAYLESYGSSRIRHIHNKPPLGLVPKLNAMVRDARGEWMLILCDDDALEPGYLSAIGKLAVAHPEAGLLRTRYLMMDDASKPVREDKKTGTALTPFEFAARIFDLEETPFRMNISGIAFRPQKLLAHGGFKDYHRSLHSDAFAWFMLGQESPSYCDERALCRIRLHHGSITMSQDKDFEGMFETQFRMKKDVEDQLRRLEERASNPVERECVEKCRTSLETYFSRWTPPYDSAFEYALRTERDPAASIERIEGIMKEFRVPPMQRFRLYRWLGKAPISLRRAALKAFTVYRKFRIQRYEEHHGVGL